MVTAEVACVVVIAVAVGFVDVFFVAVRFTVFVAVVDVACVLVVVCLLSVLSGRIVLWVVVCRALLALVPVVPSVFALTGALGAHALNATANRSASIPRHVCL